MAGDVCKAKGVKGITCPSLPRRLLPPFFPGLPPSFPYRYFFPHCLPVFSIHPFLTFCPASCVFCSFGASFVPRMSLSSSSASVQREVGRFLQRFQQGSVDSPQSPANAAGQEPASTFAPTHAEAGQTLHMLPPLPPLPPAQQFLAALPSPIPPFPFSSVLLLSSLLPLPFSHPTFLSVAPLSFRSSPIPLSPFLPLSLSLLSLLPLISPTLHFSILFRRKGGRERVRMENEREGERERGREGGREGEMQGRGSEKGGAEREREREKEETKVERRRERGKEVEGGEGGRQAGRESESEWVREGGRKRGRKRRMGGRSGGNEFGRGRRE
jgi:hypothetical protein